MLAKKANKCLELQMQLSSAIHDMFMSFHMQLKPSSVYGAHAYNTSLIHQV